MMEKAEQEKAEQEIKQQKEVAGRDKAVKVNVPLNSQRLIRDDIQAILNDGSGIAPSNQYYA
jgi:hypothetical protein